MLAGSTPAPRRARSLALLLLSALAPAFVGGLLLLSGARRDAEIGGLRLELARVAWVHDGMEHGDRASMPASMMPDMPARGDTRLSVEIALFNRSPSARRFAPEELRLYSATGRAWSPSTAENEAVTLARLQAISTRLSFDVPESAGQLHLAWERDAESATLADVTPDRHPEDEVRAPPRWPRSPADLPPGDAGSGARLFTTTLACASCHGSPDRAGSATLGPDLGRIVEEGATRAAGHSAADHVYESLLDPDAQIAPSCAGGSPCATPSAMPSYGERMSLQDMADMIAYLMSLSGR